MQCVGQAIVSMPHSVCFTGECENRCVCVRNDLATLGIHVYKQFNVIELVMNNEVESSCHFSPDMRLLVSSIDEFMFGESIKQVCHPRVFSPPSYPPCKRRLQTAGASCHAHLRPGSHPDPCASKMISVVSPDSTSASSHWDAPE